MFTPQLFASILPEILMLILGMILLVAEPFWGAENKRNAGWLTAGGLFISIVVSLLFGRPGAESVSMLGGMIRFDWLAFFLKMLFMLAAAVTALLLIDHEKAGQRGEAYLLLLASTIGMNFMAASADLVMLFLAIETASIPLYLLAGFLIQDERSTEAGFKYLLYGILTSTIMLYGLSLVYGFSGTTDMYQLAAKFSDGSLPFWVMFVTIGLLVVGVGFKVTLVPFHFWAPDVYQGAPTPVTGFLSTASKAAGFAVILRLFFISFSAADATQAWTTTFAVLAAITMTAGNLLALTQTNIKRLLAYSSIAHAGYALIGVVAYNALGATSVVFYMAAYIATNLLAFGVVMAFSKVTGLEELADFAGMSRRNPTLALMMLAAFLSLTGMPPFGGFIAKVLVFAAGVQAGYVWLVVLGALNSVIGVYYYLNTLKYVYLYRMPNEDEENHPIPLSRPYTIALALLTLGVILVGVWFGPWYAWSELGSLNLF